MPNVLPTPQALQKIAHQPRVRDFLSAAVTEGRLSHAYLFLGAPGSGMLEAADALAECVVCPNGGDGACDECIRVMHHTHPDVKHYAPEGVSGYLVDQIRSIVEDAPLTPMRAKAKVYILDKADRLWGTAANALLKTIEEPPAGTMFILIARSADAVLPTIVSRCQQVPFRVIPSSVATELVEQGVGADEDEARIALSVTGSPEHAMAFLSSPDRRNVRRVVVRTLGELAHDDTWDVLLAAREICDAVRAPLGGETRGRKGETASPVSSRDADYLSAKALRQIEEAHKRELTARERSGMMEALAAAESFLRDVLVRCEGAGEPVVNKDVADVVDQIAQQSTTAGALRALDACRTAARNIAQNVTSQLAIEVMLFDIKEALV